MVKNYLQAAICDVTYILSFVKTNQMVQSYEMGHKQCACAV